jgi:hypothetical protein
MIRVVDPAGGPILTSGIISRRVQRSVSRLLDENVLCSMATITVEGRAHINTAYFSSNQTWDNPDSGLQLFGICKQATGQETSKVEKLYGKRFVEYNVWKAGRAANSLSRDYRFYRFITCELKVFDEKELGVGIFVVARPRR